MPETTKTKSTKNEAKRLVLLDTHAIIHRAYHALPEFSNSKGNPTGALYGLSTMLIKIITDLNPDYVIACYDLPGPTFRHESYDAYKAGRAKADSDLIWQLEHSHEIFDAFGIPQYSKSSFEADDILGTIVELLKKETKSGALEIIVASGDMDTLQLVDGKAVKVYTLKKGINDTILYDEKGVIDRFGFKPRMLPDYKGLVGDPSDNIIGIKGIGDKSATVLLQNFGTIEEIYKKLKKNQKAFEEKGVKQRVITLLLEGEEEALFSKTLATIRRDAPIDFTLPTESWRDHCEIAKVEETFGKFEFRTLLERVRKLLGEAAGEVIEPERPKLDDAEVYKLGIALWVVDSNFTNPAYDDIVQFTHTHDFAKSKEFIFKELKERNVVNVYNDIELPLIPILKRAESRGIRIDIARLTELSKEYHHKLDGIEKSIYEAAGRNFNINSPKQLGEILFDELKLTAKGLKKTEGGARSTRESELVKMIDAHPIIGHILEHREIHKLLSTYIDTIPQMVDKENRLHTTFLQTGAATGRMASQNPGLQNIPIKTTQGKNIRGAFIAAEGHVLVSLDYSQIEMRVLALLSGDEFLSQIFKDGKDVHASVASRVFGVAESEVTSDMRRKAKVINFGIIYGMGVTSLQRTLGSTRAEAQEFYDGYFIKFPSIAKFFENITRDAAKKGYTETLFGRRRYFQGLNSSIPYIRSGAERMAMNAPLQGTAADIIKIAMIHVNEMLTKKKLMDDVHLLLQVHDELIFEVKTKKAEEAAQLIKEQMEGVIDPKKLPFTVDSAIGQNWGEL